MGTKVKGAESVYDAAQLWVERALRNDDSLFIPGTAIWSAKWLGELRERFLDNTEKLDGDFFLKLKLALHESPAEVYHLMGEVLYFLYLIIWQGQIKGTTKKERIERVLNWSNHPVSIPDSLDTGLTPGIARIGRALGGNLPYYAGFLIEFAEQFKRLEPSEQKRTLSDPWEFKEIVMDTTCDSNFMQTKPGASSTQREALIHLVFPCTFEYIVSAPHKQKIAERFASYYVTEATDDVDRQLAQIRPPLEEMFQCVDGLFYTEGIRQLWHPDDFNQAQWDKFVAEVEEAVDPKTLLPRVYSVDNIVDDGCFVERSRLESMLERLKGKKNLVLQGPPGTGKTWLAKRLAFALVGRKDENLVRQFQFHPNMSYEDFVRGWRPGRDGRLELIDGPFLEAANQAKDDPSNDYVVVIEEINRGNPAQIFGEMLTLLEPDKRTEGDAIALAYPKDASERVYLPENFYVIGTMNLADRSLALVDLALRRRFAFVNLEPAFGEVWRSWEVTEAGISEEFLLEIEKRLSYLNETIKNDSILGPPFQVGHSVVTTPAKTPICDAAGWFKQVVETEIGPLLEEYWFDNPEKARAETRRLVEGLSQ